MAKPEGETRAGIESLWTWTIKTPNVMARRSRKDFNNVVAL